MQAGKCACSAWEAPAFAALTTCIVQPGLIVFLQAPQSVRATQHRADNRLLDVMHMEPGSPSLVARDNYRDTGCGARRRFTGVADNHNRNMSVAVKQQQFQLPGATGRMQLQSSCAGEFTRVLTG